MASGTATTAPSTAPLPLTAGPSTIEPIVPIVAPLGAQGMPTVIQETRPVVSIVQTMQSTAVYGTLPYVSGLPYMAPLLYAAMHAMSARPSYPMGYYGQGNRFPLKPNPNLMSVREQMYNISSFRNGSNLKLGELAKPSLSLSLSPPLVLRSASAKRPRPKDQATDS